MISSQNYSNLYLQDYKKEINSQRKRIADNAKEQENIYEILQYYQNTYPLLKTALSCCKSDKEFFYKTDLYPIYLIIYRYISVFEELSFLKIEYVK